MTANAICPPSSAACGHLAAAGAAGVIAWEIVGRLVSPALIGETLSPQDLIGALAGTLFGLDLPSILTLAVHLATGILVYPMLFHCIRVLAPALGALGAGAVLGVATWVLALGVFAPIVGAPFLLGLAAISWMSLAGHLAYGLVLAAAHDRLGRG